MAGEEPIVFRGPRMTRWPLWAMGALIGGVLALGGAAADIQLRLGGIVASSFAGAALGGCIFAEVLGRSGSRIEGAAELAADEVGIRFVVAHTLERRAVPWESVAGALFSPRIAAFGYLHEGRRRTVAIRVPLGRQEDLVRLKNLATERAGSRAAGSGSEEEVVARAPRGFTLAAGLACMVVGLLALTAGVVGTAVALLVPAPLLRWWPVAAAFAAGGIFLLRLAGQLAPEIAAGPGGVRFVPPGEIVGLRVPWRRVRGFRLGSLGASFAYEDDGGKSRRVRVPLALFSPEDRERLERLARNAAPAGAPS